MFVILLLFLRINLFLLGAYEEILEETDTEEDCDEHTFRKVRDEDNTAVFVESKSGKYILEFNGYKYHKVYVSKYGSRWNCSSKKDCSAFVYLSRNDNEIIMNQDEHTHGPTRKNDVSVADKDAAVVITSRKGKEMLLFHQYTYRKQYNTGKKIRWVCSTMKNCHAAVFTDNGNLITSAYENHRHEPPKYYLNPDHVVRALRQSLILETD